MPAHSKYTGTGTVCVQLYVTTLWDSLNIFPISLEDNVSITEDIYHRSPSSLEGDVLPGDDAVKEDPTGNSLVLSSVEKLCINSHFHESSMVTVSSHSRYNKQETDINEQNVERESTGNNKR